MNKKLLVVSILAIFMLVGISFATAINPDATTHQKKMESPLFKIRTRHALGEKLKEILKNLIIKFFGERRFFLPFQWLKDREHHSIRELLQQKTEGYSCGIGCTFKFCTSGLPTTCPNHCPGSR
jgi:hypothetical protein